MLVLDGRSFSPLTFFNDKVKSSKLFTLHLLTSPPVERRFLQPRRPTCPSVNQATRHLPATAATRNTFLKRENKEKRKGLSTWNLSISWDLSARVFICGKTLDYLHIKN